MRCSNTWLNTYDHVTPVERFFLIYRMIISSWWETMSWVTVKAFSCVLTRKWTLEYSYMLLIAQSVG
jgi:hypothetical protein